MSEQEVKLDSKALVKKLTAEYYDQLMHARENGKKVAWCTSVSPQEFLEAMDVECAYPENHAAAIAARGGALELLEKAEARGYNSDLCAYARVNLAYADILESDLENIPRPDFVYAQNNICQVVIKWYENLAQIFNVPFILVDTPFNVEYPMPQHLIEYMKGQFENVIVQLEKICGKPFNYKKFYEIMDISAQAVRSWLKAMSWADYEPSPLNGFNIFNYMALIVCIRGRQGCIDLFDCIDEEMAQYIKEGKSQFKYEQKHRIMWQGIAIWPYLNYTFKTFANQGVILTGSTYPYSWAVSYEGAGDIDGMAVGYSTIPPNTNVEHQIDVSTMVVNDTKCDGVAYHINRSCKLMDFMQHGLQVGVAKNTNTPYVLFDGDQADPRAFAKAQFETRIQALVEAMEQRKQAKEAN